MRASKYEYKFRFLLHGLIYGIGFWCPWIDHNSMAAKSTWLTIAQTFASHGWLHFFAATDAVLVVALVLTGLGALLRVWGSAYVGSGVVASHNMHGDALLADGPYRRTRNPLYLGTLLHTMGLSILMPVSGAIVCVALIWLLQIRLALAEEPFLATRFGSAYAIYKARVPRFLPAPTPQVPSAGKHPRWLQSLLGEIYFVLVFLVLAVWGWHFNAQPLLRGVLISVGVWLVVRAFLPSPAAPEVRTP
jgi:protein-S-isoprenylcysteine O-methyltransferase Ste14